MITCWRCLNTDKNSILGERKKAKMKNMELSKFASAFSRHFWLRMPIFLSLLLSVWAIRFPFIFQKIYAEDGALFLADALEYSFPRDLLEPAAGYSTLIMRLGGRFVSLFPLADAALAGAFFSAVCLSVLAAGLFQYNNFMERNFWGRLTLSLGFLFLPLSSFSAVGNIANLYIYFMTAAAVFLYYHEKTKAEMVFKSSILFIAALSLPLTVFLLPIMLHRLQLDKTKIGTWKLLKSDLIFITGIIFQFGFILITSLGERAPHLPQSLFKVIYLYFERGIGISLIPKWGFVSGTSEKVVFENSANLLLSTQTRSILLLVILTLISSLFYKNRAHIGQVRKHQMLFIVILGFVYSLLVGLFFNPEPRYMIFTSFLTIWVILLLLEAEGSLKLRSLSNGYLIFVMILGLTASSHRSQGPDWVPEVNKAQETCQSSRDLQYVSIPTLPIDATWEIKISCKKLR